MCMSIKLKYTHYIWCSQSVKICCTMWFFAAYMAHSVYSTY